MITAAPTKITRQAVNAMIIAAATINIITPTASRQSASKDPTLAPLSLPQVRLVSQQVSTEAATLGNPYPHASNSLAYTLGTFSKLQFPNAVPKSIG
jgi:hypothetical protein